MRELMKLKKYLQILMLVSIGIEAQEYTSIKIFKDGYASVSTVENKYKKALLSVEGKVLTAYKYTDIDFVAEGLYRFKETEFYSFQNGGTDELPLYEGGFVSMEGILNEKGMEIIPVRKEQKVKLVSWGKEKKFHLHSAHAYFKGSPLGEAIYNLDGKVFIPYGKYRYSFNRNFKYIYVYKENKSGYIDFAGNEVVSLGGMVSYHSNHFFSHVSPDKIGVINKNRKVIIPAIYKHIATQGKNLFRTGTDTGEESFFNIKGQKLSKVDLNSSYELLGSLSKQGFCIVKKKAQKMHTLPKYYLFNIYDGSYEILEMSKGNQILSVKGFSPLGKLFSIQSQNRKWALCRLEVIDKKLQVKLLTSYMYDYIKIGKANDVAVVRLNTKSALLDNEAKQILAFEYDFIDNVLDEVIVVSKNKKYGVIDFNKKEIIPRIYKFVSFDKYENCYRVREENGNSFNLSLDVNKIKLATEEDK